MVRLTLDHEASLSDISALSLWMGVAQSLCHVASEIGSMRL